MAVVDIVQRDAYFVGFQHEETIADGETGNDIRIPPLPAGKVIAARLIAGAGTGKFQDTMSSDEDVTAGTAVWDDWYVGTQTGTVSEILRPNVTGIRGVSVSGEITVQVVI
jgi:hypothetical protein